MKCKINAWGCPYHACMSDECQRSEVISNGANFGVGLCRKAEKANVSRHLASSQMLPIEREKTRNQVYKEYFKV